MELKSGYNVVEHNVIIETAHKIINKQGKSVTGYIRSVYKLQWFMPVNGGNK